jgi:AcrR family transcriptional regulator
MRPYDERLDQFLSRAAKVFADQGYHSTTMRDLAAATGMSLAGMYYYVRGKEELLYRIQERCFTRVLAGAERALAALGRGHADPVERLQAFIRHHVTFFAANLAEMKVLSHEANSLGGERQRKVNAIKRSYVDLLEGLLRDVAPDEPAAERSAAAYALFGMMNWIYNWYDPLGDVGVELLSQSMCRLFLGGYVGLPVSEHAIPRATAG